MRTVALDVHVDAPRHALPAGQEAQTFGRVHHVADLGPFSLLDAVATCDDTGREVTIGVVNRDRDRSHAATIDLGAATATGELHVSEVNGPDVGATNSFEHPNRVGVREHRRPVTGHRFEVEFPAHSVSVLRVHLAP
jgi:alpha-L-arabinofuranosidase